MKEQAGMSNSPVLPVFLLNTVEIGDTVCVHLQLKLLSIFFLTDSYLNNQSFLKTDSKQCLFNVINNFLNTY